MTSWPRCTSTPTCTTRRAYSSISPIAASYRGPRPRDAVSRARENGPSESRGVDPEIAGYYARGLEAERLFTWGRLERVRTQELLERFLPRAPATILDVGGGPGAYALWLAGRGYAVRLIDPVELHVPQARGASAGDGGPPPARGAAGGARAAPLANPQPD